VIRITPALTRSAPCVLVGRMFIRSLWVACALTFALSQAACFKPHLGAPEARWLRVETEHFRLHTDLEPERAHKEALQLEQTFRAFLDHGWVHQGQPPFMLNTVMFSNPNEAQLYTGLDTAGYTIPDLLFEPWIVLPAPNQVDGLDVLRHELTHYIAHQAIRHHPTWFGEGIAGYFQTAHFVSETEFEVGGVPRALFYELQRSGPLPVSRIWEPEGGVQTRRYYATAWALVHYLMTEHAEEFVVYQRCLARGLSDEAAWQAAFPNLPRQAVDAKLRLYLEVGLYEKSVQRITSQAIAVKSTPLSQGDQYALDGLLWRSCVHCGEPEKARSRQSLAMALTKDPDQLQASVLGIMEQANDPQAGSVDALRLVQRYPQEWLAWASLAVAQSRAGSLSQGRDRDAVAQLVRLAPRNPYTWFFAAVQHAERGQRDLALQALARMRRIDPANVTLLASAVNVMSKLGACDELRDASRSLSELSHVGIPPSLQRQLGQWSETCRPVVR